MDLALLVYGISVMVKLSALLGGIVLISSAALVAGLLTRGFHAKETWHDAKDESIYQPRRELATRIIKWSIGLILGSSLILAFIPSERTAYTMVGAYAAQKVAENDNVQRLSGKVLTVIEQKLDSFIQEGVDKISKDEKKK